MIRDEAVDHAAEMGRLIRAWEPPETPHCSDCRWAIVGGTPDEPTVSCAQAHGPAEIPLWRLIRPKHPRGFRSAEKCPHFDSMGGKP